MLSSVSLPKGLLSVGRSAFNGCESLDKITLPNKVKSIGVYAFRNIPNIKITIPKSVESIADNAFEGCKNVVICGEKGSFAEEFSIQKRFKFKPL